MAVSVSFHAIRFGWDFEVRKFAGLSASSVRLGRVSQTLFLLPVFTGNSFPGYPNTTVD